MESKILLLLILDSAIANPRDWEEESWLPSVILLKDHIWTAIRANKCFKVNVLFVTLISFQLSLIGYWWVILLLEIVLLHKSS